MFDLNEAIAGWRRSLEEGGIVRREVLDELESHLRDEVDQLVRSGVAVEEAFGHATRRLGKADDLSEEFSKVQAERYGLMQLINGEVLTMNGRNDSRINFLTILLLFVGFSGLFGWLGTTWWVVDGMKFRGMGFREAVMRVGYFSIFGGFFLIYAVAGLTLGAYRIRQVLRKKRLLLCSLIPAFLLTPVFVTLPGLSFIAIGLILVPLCLCGSVHAAVSCGGTRHV